MGKYTKWINKKDRRGVKINWGIQKITRKTKKKDITNLNNWINLTILVLIYESNETWVGFTFYFSKTNCLVCIFFYLHLFLI